MALHGGTFMRRNKASYTAACLPVLAALSTLISPAWGAGATNEYRLPSSVVPSKYDLSIEPDLTKSTFAGEESIAIDIKSKVSQILLNSVDLNVSNVVCTLQSEKAKSFAASRVEKLAKQERVAISFPGPLNPGLYTLKLHFNGILKDDLRGLYRSSIKDASGKKTWIAATQMEPTDARRMFPCFDEPAFKAAFRIKVTVDKDLVAISNAPVEAEEQKSAKKVVQFKETPVMSTYLVALVVGPFEAQPAKIACGVPVRVWSVPGKSALGEYAQDVAIKLLPYYNEYFGQPYPAPKLDLIGIPDFEAGAMENLGAITFREATLLNDTKISSAQTRHNIASIVAHEMAHMWFGDLVTMKWWDDLWLNEAFATWMSMKAVDYLRPDWHEWDDFGLYRNSSMHSDSLHEARAIHCKVDNPEQAHDMFDDITYGKGSSVLRMLETYVGEPVFQKGVQEYIKTFAFKNATTDDLWQAVGHASSKDINSLMHSWIYQPGLPLVKLSAKNAVAVTASQKRYMIIDEKNDLLWQVPLTVRALGSDKVESKLLDSRSGELKIDLPMGQYVVNAGGNGYFRVQYPPEAVAALGKGARRSLTVCERISLLADQWALVAAGAESVANYLNLTGDFKEESDPNVMSLLIGHLYALNSHCDENLRGKLAVVVQDRLSIAKDKLGWKTNPSDNDLTKHLRAQVLEVMGTIGGDKKTIDEARDLFARYLKDTKAVDPDCIDPMVQIVAYNGSPAEYEQFVKLWHASKTPDAELRNLMALGAFREPGLIDKTLNLCMSNGARSQDQPRLINAVSHSPVGRQIVWKFIQARWPEIMKHFPDHIVPRIASCLSSLDSANDALAVKTFFDKNKVPYGTHTVKETVERINCNAAFKKRTDKDLSTWLTAFTPAGAGNSRTEATNDIAPKNGALKDGIYLVDRYNTDLKQLEPINEKEQLVVNDYHLLQPAERQAKDYFVVRTESFIPILLGKDPEKDIDSSGKPRLQLQLAEEQAGPLEAFTAKNLGRTVAIVIGGEVVSSHKIRQAITGGRLQITRCTDTGCEAIYSELRKEHNK
jgi:puromycin-sensitive aminopeptidase